MSGSIILFIGRIVENPSVPHRVGHWLAHPEKIIRRSFASAGIIFIEVPEIGG